MLHGTTFSIKDERFGQKTMNVAPADRSPLPGAWLLAGCWSCPERGEEASLRLAHHGLRPGGGPLLVPGLVMEILGVVIISVILPVLGDRPQHVQHGLIHQLQARQQTLLLLSDSLQAAVQPLPD